MAHPAELSDLAAAARTRTETTRRAPARRSARRRGDARGLAVSTALLFLFFAAAAAPSPLLPLLLTEWGFAPWLLTFAFAVYALAILAALLVVGRLSDSIGRRPVILAATALELVSMILFLLAGDIGAFVVARVLQGLATGAATGALSAAIADFATERRTRLAATLGSVGPLAGLAAGAVFAGAVAEYFAEPTSAVFGALALLFAIGLVGAVSVRESSSRRPGALRSLIPKVAVPPAARRSFWKALPIAVAVWMVGGFYLSVIGETARELLAISDEFGTSLFIAGLSGTGAITVSIARRLEARTGATLGVLLVAIGMVVSIVGIDTASVPLLIVGTVVSGCGFGMAFSGAVGLVLPHVRAHERGEVFSAIYVVNYLAFGLPAIAAGLLIAPLGLRTAVLVYAAAAVAVAVIGLFVQTVRGPGPRRSS
jgi:MFS family permease